MSITAYCGIEFDQVIQGDYSDNAQPTVRKVDNAIIFPKVGDWPTNVRGGVYDADLNFISGHKHNRNLDRGWGHICPLYDDEKKIDNELLYCGEEVIYGGYIFGSYGHFLLETLSRLWFLILNRDKYKYTKTVFLVYTENSISGYVYKMLNLLEIDIKNIVFLKRPTRFLSVIVPEQSFYMYGLSYFDYFLLPYNLIVDTVNKSLQYEKYEKIYLSRGHFHKNNVLNESYFESFYEQLGFKIIYPESLPIEQQIYIISNADEIVSTIGTISHQMVFSNSNAKLTILLRQHSKNPGIIQPQIKIVQAKGNSCNIIDVSSEIFPVITHSLGPFFISPNKYWIRFVGEYYDIKLQHDGYTEYLNNKNEIGYYLKKYFDDIANSPDLLSGHLHEKPIIILQILQNIERLFYDDTGRSKKIKQEIEQLYGIDYDGIDYDAIFRERSALIERCVRLGNKLKNLQQLFDVPGQFGRAEEERPLLRADIHVATEGWIKGLYETLEWQGQNDPKRRIEALRCRFVDHPDWRVSYRVRDMGLEWGPWVADGEMAGTTGKSASLSGIAFRFEDGPAMWYSVRYRIRTTKSDKEWSPWAEDGADCVAEGGEGIVGLQVELVNRKDNTPRNYGPRIDVKIYGTENSELELRGVSGRGGQGRDAGVAAQVQATRRRVCGGSVCGIDGNHAGLRLQDRRRIHGAPARRERHGQERQADSQMGRLYRPDLQRRGGLCRRAESLARPAVSLRKNGHDRRDRQHDNTLEGNEMTTQELENPENGRISADAPAPKVSVIVPMYNPGPGFERCLESLRSQTLADIEMIFVDDCGTDGAMEQVRAAAGEDPRIRIIANPENLGPGLSRNAGIEAARGEYISFVDADDHISPDFLELLHDKAVAEGLDIAKGTAVYMVDGAPRQRELNRNEVIRSGLAEGKPLYGLFVGEHWTGLYRRALLMESGARYGRARNSQDDVFLLRVCRAARTFGIEERATYHYVYRTSSVVNTFIPRRLQNQLENLREMMDDLVGQGAPDLDVVGYASGKIMYFVMMQAYAAGLPGLAEAADAFLAGIREQALRLPFIESAKTERFGIRALVDFGVGLSLTPYPGLWRELDNARARLDLAGRWCDFALAHPELVAEYGKDLSQVLENAAEAVKWEKRYGPRIDVKIYGTENSELELRGVSGKGAKVETPEWLRKSRQPGVGYVVVPHAGQTEITLDFVCKTGGEFTALLRGANVTDKSGKRIPKWVTYTGLTCNGEVVFEGEQRAWHDQSYCCKKTVAAGDAVTLAIRWRETK